MKNLKNLFSSVSINRTLLRKFVLLKSLSVLICALFIISVFSVNCKQNPKTIKIGAILPLTGPIAAIGEPEREALLLAQRKIDEALKSYSSRNVKIIIEDSKSDPKEAVNIIQKLINLDDVKFFIVSTSPSILATMPIIKEKNLIMFANTSTPGITDGKNIFRVSPNSEQEIYEVVSYLKRHSIKKCVFIYPNNEFGRIIYHLFDSSYAHFGTIMYASEYNVGDKDFKSLILKIKKIKDIEVIIFEGYPADTPVFLRQARELGIKQPFITSMATTWPACLDAITKMKETPVFIVPTMIIQSKQLPLTKQFIEHYTKEYGKQPNYDALFLYDTALLISDLLSKIPLLSTDEFRKKLYENSTYNGVAGQITLMENGDCNVSLSAAIFKDSVYVLAE
ncbi:MAG: ABC transporter substrate-binding protein [bacterium]